MSRKVSIVVREEGGVIYGRVVKATEHMLMQDFAHSHIEGVVRDKLMRNATQAEVAGFNYTLPGGMNFSVGEGHAIDVTGRSFDTLPSGAVSVVTIPAAHASLPRIDLVYATLVADSDREETPLPFRRQLTDAELAAGTDPYPITNTNVPTRRDNVAIIGVRQGVAASVPVAPAAGVNEVALYQVRVNAGVTGITADKVTDVRRQMKSLNDALIRLDALEANPAILNLSEAVDDRVAVLIADSTTLTRTYDDAGNLLTLEVDTAWLSEHLDDRVNALLVDSTHLTKVYDDAGNLLTLDVDIAAVGPALDSRFVNVVGDDMTGRLRVLRDASPVSLAGVHGIESHVQGGVSPGMPVRAVVGIARVTGTNGGDPGTAIGGYFRGRHEGGPGNQNAIAYGVYGDIEQIGSPLNPAWYAVFGNTNNAAGASTFAGYFNGKVHVVGALSKGSGTFLIDHPLDPTGKDLVHGFVESSEYLLVYRVTATLIGGAAEIDLDEYLGLTAGTLAAIADDLKVYGLYSTGADHVEVSVGGSSLFLTSANGADTSTVNMLIIGRRKDPYIKLDPWTDSSGALVPEHDKVEATSSGLALVRVPVAEANDLAGTAETKANPVLAGREGFPRYPSVVFDSVEPAETFAYMPEAWEQLGPAPPTIGANVAGVGTRAWTDASMILGADGSKAKVSIGVQRSAASNYLVARGYGFVVPEGATVRAVVVEIRRMLHDSWRPFSVVTDNVVALTVNGAVRDSVNKAAEGVEWADGFLRVASYAFTGPDLDGLTYEDFNAPEFGVALSASLEFTDEEEAPVCTAGVDTIRVTLFYE